MKWEIYEYNHKYFVIFTINHLNFFLSTLAKDKLISTNYPSLQNKTNIVSSISSNQTQLSRFSQPRRPKTTIKVKSDHNLSGSNTNRHHLMVWVIFLNLLNWVRGWIWRQCACRTKLRATSCLSHQPLEIH